MVFPFQRCFSEKSSWFSWCNNNFSFKVIHYVQQYHFTEDQTSESPDLLCELNENTRELVWIKKAQRLNAIMECKAIQRPTNWQKTATQMVNNQDVIFRSSHHIWDGELEYAWRTEKWSIKFLWTNLTFYSFLLKVLEWRSFGVNYIVLGSSMAFTNEHLRVTENFCRFEYIDREELNQN